MMRIQAVAVRGCIAIVTLTVSVATAVAQSSKNPDPADPGAAAPVVKHESVFLDYQPFREQKIRPWKEVNQEVADNPGMGAMDSMKDMNGMNKEAASPPMSKGGHSAMAMAKPQTAPGQPANAQTADVTATGVVLSIDKANGKIKLMHDPIAALAWPKMTMFFRLKDNALADKVRAGDRVEFSLEKSASGYVISGLKKGAAGHDMKQMK